MKVALMKTVGHKIAIASLLPVITITGHVMAADGDSLFVSPMGFGPFTFVIGGEMSMETHFILVNKTEIVTIDIHTDAFMENMTMVTEFALVLMLVALVQGHVGIHAGNFILHAPGALRQLAGEFFLLTMPRAVLNMVLRVR